MAAQDKGTKPTLNNIDLPDAALGAFAVLLGTCVAIVATGYRDGSTYDSLGPSLLPLIIAAGLILTGLPILIRALLSGPRATPAEQMDWMPVVFITVGLIVPIAFIVVLGWIPVTTVVFALGARAFGSRRPALDLGIGFVFGVLTFAIFDYALGLQLPSGWIITRVFG